MLLALKKRGGQQAQALGRSRGGFSTKIHISVDALGIHYGFWVQAVNVTIARQQRHWCLASHLSV